MKSEIIVSKDDFLEIYVTLSLLAMTQCFVPDEHINTKITLMEDLYQNQTGESIFDAVKDEI